jgi:hypothetical protein
MTGGRRRTTTRPGRPALLLAALVLALAVVACGSDDDGGSAEVAQAGSDDRGGAGGAEPVATGGSPEDQIKAVYAAYVAGFYDKDPEAICATMTTSLQRQIAASRTCASVFEPIVASELGKSKPYIAKLTVRGSKATATVKTKTSNGYPARFAKQDGVWKISGGAGLDSRTGAVGSP